MTIGRVARQAGLRPSAIRFFEKTGLLPRPLREGGQRRYDTFVFDRLALLEFAKQCGFTLAEIRQLFGGFQDKAPISARVQKIANRKMQELDELARRIEGMKSALARAGRCRCIDLDECGQRLRTSGK